MMQIVIPFAPVPKGRPRFTKDGHAYTPQRTREYEAMVRMYAKSAKIRPLTGAICMTVTFYLPIPKSWPKAKKRAAAEGTLLPAVKPDLDNLEKAICDALNDGIGYADDKLIVEKHSYKYYSEDPRTVIRLEERQ